MSATKLHELIPYVSVPSGVSGDWEVRPCLVDEETAHAGKLRAMVTGRGWIEPGIYTMLTHRRAPVMSDTPDEKRDHADFVRRAHGDVLIHGLGIGMALNACLRKLEVRSVTVVELSTDVIELVWPTYSFDPRARLIQGDAFTYEPGRGRRWDCIWHDIWPTICRDNLPEMKRLRKRFARRCGWQGFWCIDECKEMLR